MKTDDCHLSGFRRCFERSFYELYDMSNLNFGSKFLLKLRFCFIILP